MIPAGHVEAIVAAGSQGLMRFSRLGCPKPDARGTVSDGYPTRPQMHPATGDHEGIVHC
jgi:hypothetical protein